MFHDTHAQVTLRYSTVGLVDSQRQWQLRSSRPNPTSIVSKNNSPVHAGASPPISMLRHVQYIYMWMDGSAPAFNTGGLLLRAPLCPASEKVIASASIYKGGIVAAQANVSGGEADCCTLCHGDYKDECVGWEWINQSVVRTRAGIHHPPYATRHLSGFPVDGCWASGWMDG